HAHRRRAASQTTETTSDRHRERGGCAPARYWLFHSAAGAECNQSVAGAAACGESVRLHRPCELAGGTQRSLRGVSTPPDRTAIGPRNCAISFPHPPAGRARVLATTGKAHTADARRSTGRSGDCNHDWRNIARGDRGSGVARIQRRRSGWLAAGGAARDPERRGRRRDVGVDKNFQRRGRDRGGLADSRRDELIARGIQQCKDGDPSDLLTLAIWLNSKREFEKTLEAIPLEKALLGRDLFLQYLDALGGLERWGEIKQLLDG